jgi:hypothetical protein
MTLVRGSSLYRTGMTDDSRQLFRDRLLGRGLNSSTFQLNLSALYGIGGARRGYVARLEGVSEGV